MDDRQSSIYQSDPNYENHSLPVLKRTSPSKPLSGPRTAAGNVRCEAVVLTAAYRIPQVRNRRTSPIIA